MKIEDIKEPLSYRWKRTLGGTTKTGRGPVVQTYHVPGRGWYVILDDVKTSKPVTLRPAHVVARFTEPKR